MQVGVNYPWLDYGWDFGLAPPGWRRGRTTPRWLDEIDSHLAHFRDLGVSVVRWFVLADGLTYGTGRSAPQPDPSAPHGWRFDPPPIGDECLQDFEDLLHRFVQAGGGDRPLRLLPVLVDFYFCQPGIFVQDVPDAWVKQGRAEAVADPDRREQFLARALEPLLDVSQRYRDVIYAWELINEPDWVTRGWHSRLAGGPSVPEPAMRAFLESGKARIRDRGFKSTIGFASLRTIERSGITADVNQFHHYPGGVRRLLPHPFPPEFPGIIGEFATAVTDIWPELRGGNQGVHRRLEVAEARGYSLALPWAFLSTDRHTRWSRAVEDEIRAFTARSR